MNTPLKRYTTLPFLLHMLHTKELALLSPNSWDDRNDALYIERYRKKIGLSSVFALCLTEAEATYHHWKVFAGNSSGICIAFHSEKLVKWAESKGIRSGLVDYKSLARARRDPPTLEMLPFRKRHAFRDEKEFRLVYEAKTSSGSAIPFKLDLDTIDHIVVNPWLSRDVFKSVKASIHAVPECNSLEVKLSRMLTNKEWAEMGEDSP